MNNECKIQSSEDPYKYLLITDFLSESDSSKIYSNLNLIDNWKLHTEYFFEQWEYKFKLSSRNDFIDLLQDIGTKIKSLLEAHFETNLDPTFDIVAHKLEKDQYISIHNDCPKLGFETHRLVINFNPAFDDECGGHFYICAKKDPNSISKIIRPIINSAFAFEASPKSYHAIGKVLKGPRFSIVFSFWHKANTREIERKIKMLVVDRVAAFKETICQRDLDFLIQHKIDKIKNRNNSLLDHFIETFSLLKSWKLNNDICRLGLFHSFLGSKTITIPNEESKKSDLLNYDRDLFHLVQDYVENTYTKSSNDSAFWHCYFANLLTSKMNIYFDQQIWFDEKTLLTTKESHLNEIARNDLNILYSQN